MQPANVDLFGNEAPAPKGHASASAMQFDLIDAAAERAALASGRPKSQERCEILAGQGPRAAC